MGNDQASDGDATTGQHESGLADNKLALNAGWDEQLLALELGKLAALGLDFDLTITGFEMAEIDLLIGADA